MDVLEYVIRLRGAAAAAAEMRGLAGEMNTLAASERRVGESGLVAERGTGKMAAALGGLARIAKVGGLALVATGLEAVKLSTNFNHEMLRIRTDAGASTRELANMKKGVLDLASSGASMGSGPMSLAQGLYHLESLGLRGSKALYALKVAAQETAISGANLEQTTTSLGAAMFVGIKGTGTLSQLMGTLNAIVGAGNMRFQGLNEALGTGLLSSAKTAGLSLQGIGAALAVATDAGYAASSAAAQMGTALHFLYAPTAKAQKALDSIHMSSTQMAGDLHKPNGLFVALTDLKKHLAGLSQVQQAQVLNAILPGGRGRILLAELTMLDRLHTKYNQINRSAGGFGGAVAQQRRDPQTQLKTAEAGFQAAMIRLGNVLTPVVIPALAALVHVGTDVVKFLTGLPRLIDSVGGAFGKGAGPIADFGRSLGKAFTTISHLASGLWKALQKTFGDIGREAHKVFSGSFLKDLVTIGKAVVAFGVVAFRIFSTLMKAVLPPLALLVKGTFNVIAGLVHFIAAILTGDFGKAWGAVKQIFGGALRTIVALMRIAFTVTLGPIIAAAKLAIHGLGDAISWLWHNVFEPIVKFITGAFKTGWDLLTAGFSTAKGIISALLSPLDGVFSKLKSIGDWVSSAGSTVTNFLNSLNPFSSGTVNLPGVIAPGASPIGPLSPTTTPTGQAPGTPPIIPVKHAAFAPAGVRAPHAAAAGWHHGDIIVQVAGTTMARVMRNTLQEAMARGA